MAVERATADIKIDHLEVNAPGARHTVKIACNIRSEAVADNNDLFHFNTSVSPTASSDHGKIGNAVYVVRICLACNKGKQIPAALVGHVVARRVYVLIGNALYLVGDLAYVGM